MSRATACAAGEEWLRLGQLQPMNSLPLMGLSKLELLVNCQLWYLEAG